MSQYDADDCLQRYFALARARPGLFANPPGDIYEILLDPSRIRHAQAEAMRSREAERLPVADLRVGVLAEDPYVTVLREAVRFPEGSYGLYNRLILARGVVVLPVLDGKLVLIRRFRHGTRSWHLEAPRGTVSSDERIEEDARRELMEEIGAQTLELLDLGEFHPSAGVIAECMKLFLARIDGVGALEKHEAISGVEILDRAEAEALIARGDVTDGPTLAAYLRAKLRGYV
ncbi:MAG: NUDIX hydrolase [Burkholderiales bacterium]